MRKTGRNQPCLCGSGLKFKSCCLYRNENSSTIDGSLKEGETKAVPPFSSHFLLMPSIEFKGYRLRFIFNKVHYRPLNETFHDFLFEVIKLTFGERWFKKQKGMLPDNKHVVFKWFEDVREFRSKFSERIKIEKNEHGKIFSAEVDGPQQALLSLGWDLYCLQSKEKLPCDILKKLIKNKEFQSFRYEIAVAALMVRAGFKIKWYDISGQKGKQSEFLATHLHSEQQLTVEAKSLRRDGILHNKGSIDVDDNKTKQIVKLLKVAEKKKKIGIPHAVFIDINRPPEGSQAQSDIDYLKSLINAMPRISPEKPAKHEILVLTNFTPYFGGIGKPVPKYQNYPVIPQHSFDKRELSFYSEIFNSLDFYSFVPEEI